MPVVTAGLTLLWLVGVILTPQPLRCCCWFDLLLIVDCLWCYSYGCCCLIVFGYLDADSDLLPCGTDVTLIVVDTRSLPLTTFPFGYVVTLNAAGAFVTTSPVALIVTDR